jgi:hypothetical protein
MGILRNPQLEIVAQELAAGKLPEPASAAAGYDTAASSFAPNARRRAQNAKVRARVVEIQQIGARCAAISAEMLIVEAEEARLLAMEDRSPSAAISAIVCKGKLSGIWKDKAEFTGKDGAPLVPALDDASRAKALRSFLRKVEHLAKAS